MLLNACDDIVQVHEHERKGVYVQDLSEVVVNSVQDVILLLSQVAPTTSYPGTVAR
jgi:hypothetical protein